MNLGIVIHSADAETVWNAFRLGVFALQQRDRVKVFLLAQGVDCESRGTERFDIQGQMRTFVDNGGVILACGTCLKIRQRGGSALCPLSTMKDLYDLIRDSDKVVTF